MFLDEVELEDEVITAIENADILIPYVRHPDVVAEICDYQKPTILPVHFGEGFFNQVKRDNPNITQPVSMCNALPNTGIPIIDDYFKIFGTPEYELTLEQENDAPPIVKHIRLVVESPCGASAASLDQIKGKPLTPETLSEFALNVRQECREPMSIIFDRSMADTSAMTHLIQLFKAIEKIDPELLNKNTPLGNYAMKIQQDIDNNPPRI